MASLLPKKQRICTFYNTKKGCKKGELCTFKHQSNKANTSKTTTPSKSTKNTKRSPSSSAKKKKSSPQRKAHYTDANQKEFYVGGTFVVTNHPIHGPSLLVFYNPTRWDPRTKKKTGSWETPQGKYETTHLDVAETCRAELFEESCGLIDVDSNVFNTCPFINLPNSSVNGRNSYSRFYVIRIDHESLFNPHDTFVSNLQIVQEGADNGSLKDQHVYCYLEMNKVGFLPLQTLLSKKWKPTKKTTFQEGRGAELQGYVGSNSQQTTSMYIWLLKATLIARGIDAKGEPKGQTGLELITSMFDDKKVKAKMKDEDGKGETKTSSSMTIAITYGLSQRVLNTTHLGSIGVKSIHITSTENIKDAAKEEEKTTSIKNDEKNGAKNNASIRSTSNKTASPKESTTKETSTESCSTCSTTFVPTKKTTCPCKGVYYCNSFCQSKHWKTHKQEHKRLVKEFKLKKAKQSGESKKKEEHQEQQPPQPPQQEEEEDDCPICYESLPKDHAKFLRMTCCGKGMHDKCAQQLTETKSLTWKQKLLCILCRQPAANMDTKEGIQLDTERCQHWTNRGKAWGMVFMAQNYRDGLGVKQSSKKAIELYVRASKKGDMVANFKLGVFYHTGLHGLQKSIKKAVYYTKLAAKQGHVKAQFNLGGMYCMNTELRSIKKAVEWLNKAAEQKYQPAIDQMNKINQTAQKQGVDVFKLLNAGK